MRGLTLEKWQSIRRSALRIGCSPHDLATVICFETSTTFSPAVRNKDSKAVGLIQFTKIGLSGMKESRTLDEIAKLSFEEQMVLVERYIKGHQEKTKSTLADLYMLVFSPKYAGAAMTSILYKAPSKSYTFNKGLDKEGKGYITKRDAALAVYSHLPKVVKRVMELELED